MRRMVLALVAALALTGTAHAQQIDTGSISAGGSNCTTAARCAIFALPPTTSSLTLTISGTYSATLQFEASSDGGTTWFSIAATLLSDGSNNTSTTSTGQFAIGNAGLTHVRVRCSAFTSGPATVTAVRGFALGTSNTSVSAVSSVVAGVGATNLGKAEDAAHTSSDTGVFALGVIDATNATQRAASGDYAQFTVDHYGTQLVRSDHPNRFHCVVTVSTATTMQAVGGSCAAPGAGLSLYVTDITFAASAAGIAADAFPTLKSGTGGTCGSDTAVVWQALTAAAIVAVENRTIPIKIPANNELCWISSTAGSKAIQISGFIAP